MKRSILLCNLLVTMTNCGVNYDRLAEKTHVVPDTLKQQERSVKEYLSPEFKQWFQNLGCAPIRDQASKATVKIVPKISLHSQLSIPGDENFIVVNASNEDISFGGGGLNGALCNHVNTQYNHEKWMGLRQPPAPPAMWGQGQRGTNMSSGQKVPVGAYAISDIGGLYNKNGNLLVNPNTKKGEIYHAVGPKASEIASLSDAKNQVKNLYYHVCKKAAHHTGYLVMPAISTVIVANADYSALGFTKNQFIAAMYEGMYEGIRKYQCDTCASAQGVCCIILNNWEPFK